MKITKTEKVKMSWDSFTFPITVGTPVSNGGVLADSASAYGLIVRTIFAKPDADETAEIMTGGVIDMEEVSAGYGKELSSAAVQALCGIHFYKNGVCIPTGGGGVTPEIMAQIENAQWKTESSEELFSETVTTVAGEFFNGATLSYAEPITADTLKVIFNGVEYTCPNTATPEDIAQGVNGLYGAPINPETGANDWSEYPFAIYSYNSGGSVTNDIQTENAGTYSVSAIGSTTECTQTFIDSVRKYTSVNIKYIKDYKGVDGYTGGVAEGGYYNPENGETIEDAKITNKAEGIASHAEGYNTSASGSCSHTEGLNTTATGRSSHAEGEGTTAGDFGSHAEGEGTTASGNSSHAEGISTTASGRGSHAEGEGTTASGQCSHAEGDHTIASKQYQHVFGRLNKEDTSATAFGTFIEIVGNGTGNNRKNARTLDWNGNECLEGSLTLGMGTANEVTVTPAQLKALIALLNT